MVKKALADTICDGLEIHATLEEEIFYPVMRQVDGKEPLIHKAEPEHDEMRLLIAPGLNGPQASGVTLLPGLANALIAASVLAPKQAAAKRLASHAGLPSRFAAQASHQ